MDIKVFERDKDGSLIRKDKVTSKIIKRTVFDFFDPNHTLSK